MRLCQLAVGSGGVGVQDGTVVRDAGALAMTLPAAIQQGLARGMTRRQLDALPALAPAALRFGSLAGGRIFCVGKNYRAHAAEMGGAPPANINIFTRYAESVVGHGEPLVHPGGAHLYDYEGELAVVIGKPGRRISKADALGHVAGYSLFMDGSVRDYQKHSFFAGKNFVASGACGPWFVPVAEVADPHDLQLTTRINTEVRQDASTRDMVFSIAEIIAYLSEVLSLQASDVIATGTPEGVAAGRTPPLWLAVGDRVEVTVSSIGTLSNVVS